MNIFDEKCCQITSYFIMRYIQQNNIPSTVGADYIKETYLKPFWRMIHYYYDSSENILHWLLKYKKRTEWYDSEKILQELKIFRKNNPKNPRIEEKYFAPKINKYLFDKEIEIISEPKTCGRRVDVLGLIPNEQGYSNFILEYKVFLEKNTDKKRYFKEAFYQTYLYGKEYQKNIVYLVVFIIGEGDVELNLDQLNLENDLSIPYFEFDNVRIVVIKIMLKSSNFKGEINKDDLITFFKQKQN